MENMVSIIDNLDIEKASASELEQAIKTFEKQTDEPKPEVPIKEEQPKAQEKKEEVIEAAPTPKEEQPVKAETPEYDFRKGYEGLRAWNTKISQELGELKKILTQQQPQLAQHQVIEQAQSTYEQWKEAFDTDPIRTSQELAKQIAIAQSKGIEEKVKGLEGMLTAIVANSTANEFRNKYDDFKAYENDIRDELEKLPSEVINNPGYFNQVLETAYWTVKGKRAKDEISKVREETAKKMIEKKAEKEQAYVEGSTKTEVEQPFNISEANSEELFKYMQAKGIVR
jgi:hypothetical protein